MESNSKKGLPNENTDFGANTESDKQKKDGKDKSDRYMDGSETVK